MGVSLGVAQRHFTKAFLLARDTDVPWSLRNHEAGRLADHQSNPREEKMKIRSVVALSGLAISFALPSIAEEQNTFDPEVRQQIEAAVTKYEDAYNKNDAGAIAALYTADAASSFPLKS
jgi:hypothetical protein